MPPEGIVQLVVDPVVDPAQVRVVAEDADVQGRVPDAHVACGPIWNVLGKIPAAFLAKGDLTLLIWMGPLL